MAPLRYARVSPRRVVCAPSAVRLADVSHVELGTRCFGGGNTGPPPERVPLSPLDTFLFVRLLTIPVAFFYASRVDEATLVESLAKTLARFPLVAGACAWRCTMRAPLDAQQLCYAPTRAQGACARQCESQQHQLQQHLEEPALRRQQQRRQSRATLTSSATTKASYLTCACPREEPFCTSSSKTHRNSRFAQ